VVLVASEKYTNMINLWMMILELIDLYKMRVEETNIFMCKKKIYYESNLTVLF
jgi:hypothetical protein